MKKFLKYSLLVSAALFTSVAFSSCDDKDEPGNNAVVEPGVESVFTNGLPQSVDGATFKTNDKGQVTEILDGSDKVTFQYGKFKVTRATETEFDVLMSIVDADYPNEKQDIYMKLNQMGFVEYAYEVYSDETDIDEWWFEYNAAGQLSGLKRTEGGDNFKITYANGDIAQVNQTEEDGDTREYNFYYTNDTFKSLVPNNGNLMMFDDFFRIDMDEMGVAYFAGLLGKSTTNLPMGYTGKGVEGGDSYTTESKYNWTIVNGFPTEFWEEEWGANNKISFSWK